MVKNHKNVNEMKEWMNKAHLDDLLGIPHRVLEVAVLALLTLLAVELEHDDAAVGGVVQGEPEDDAPLHGRPAVAALLGWGTLKKIKGLFNVI